MRKRKLLFVFKVGLLFQSSQQKEYLHTDPHFKIGLFLSKKNCHS